MQGFFKALGEYIKIADFSSFEFWIYPIVTILAIWLLTIIALKIIPKGKDKLKTVFRIHKFWIINSLIIATIIIGLLCFWWATNYFRENPIQLSLLISLFISLIIPIIIFSILRKFFTNNDIKEITQQPKTPSQQEKIITETKKSYRKIRFFYLLLLIGFLFLLFSLNTGKNLISIVFDNSASMQNANNIEDAKDALLKTFDKLGKNNEIILTTLEGLGKNSTGGKNTINEILEVKDYSQLQAGNVIHYTDPISAKNGLNHITNQVWGSPIYESIWKTYLFAKNNLENESYKNKALIIITDGEDNIKDSIPSSSKFFFDDEGFASYYSPEKTFIIEYSGGATNPFLQKFQDEHCEIFPATTKEDYLMAIETALYSFSKDWNLIFWTITITVILSIIAFLIEPKKII